MEQRIKKAAAAILDATKSLKDDLPFTLHHGHLETVAITLVCEAEVAAQKAISALLVLRCEKMP